MMDRREMLKSGAAVAAAGVLLPLSSADAAPSTPARFHVRPANARGHVNHGWLDTYHSFSFASYHDPKWMGFRSLRVINEDVIAAGRGFPLHPHDNMEIITYVMKGSLEHKDTLGNGSVITPGEIQRMSAGTGIRHSEFNPASEDPVHLLQVWIQPDRRSARPSYAQKTFTAAARRNTLRLVASKSGRDESIPINQDANVLAGTLDPGRRLTWRNPAHRHVWLQVASGSLELSGRKLGAGDAAYTSEVGDLTSSGGSGGAEVLLFDLG